MRRRAVYIIAAVLAAASLSLFFYKVWVLGYPLLPSETESVWDVEMRVRFAARGGPTKVRLAIPESGGEFAVIDENFISSGYGLSTAESAQGRHAIWSKREAVGDQVLYYRAAIQKLRRDAGPARDFPPDLQTAELTEAELAAAYDLLSEAMAQSADLETLIPQLVKRLEDPEPGSSAALLTGSRPTLVTRLDTAVRVLALGETPARSVRGVRLERLRRDAPTANWLEVYDGNRWSTFDAETGQPGAAEGFLVLTRGGGSLAGVQGGDAVELTMAVRASEAPGVRAAASRSELLHPSILRLSLLSLPIQTQELYRVLLLVPVGAFLLVLLRSVVGIKTFGTFMPVLIALAFRETKLLWGVLLFLVIVAVGLTLRFYLERLQLLLVPRLAVVLIVVVLSMLMVSVLSQYVGVESGLSVALFPMVILTIIIERMSVVWEERGASEAMQQGIGSLLVAVLAYFVMNSPWVGHWVFVFPELLLLLLAATLLLGTYTGYRLVEYWRFRSIAEEWK